MAGSKSCRTSIGRHSGRLPRAEVRSNDLYSNRASGGETGGKDMRARSVVAAPREPPIAVTLAGGGQERTGRPSSSSFLQQALHTRPFPLTAG